jgi:hypothetical protein
MKIRSMCATALAQNALINNPYIYRYTIYSRALIRELQEANNQRGILSRD